MPVYELIITSVDKYTGGGSITIAIPDTASAKFSLGHGIHFQPGRPAPIRFTEVCLREDLFILGRQLDDTTPWHVVLYVETDQDVIEFRSCKSFSGTLLFLSGSAAASHKDDAGDTSILSLRLDQGSLSNL